MLSPRDRLLAEMLVSQRRVTTHTIAQVIAVLHKNPGNTLADELVKRGVVNLEVLQSAFEGVKKHGARCVTCGRPFIRRRPGQIMCRRCRRSKSSALLQPWDTGANLPPVTAAQSPPSRSSGRTRSGRVKRRSSRVRAQLAAGEQRPSKITTRPFVPRAQARDNTARVDEAARKAARAASQRLGAEAQAPAVADRKRPVTETSPLWTAEPPAALSKQETRKHPVVPPPLPAPPPIPSAAQRARRRSSGQVAAAESSGPDSPPKQRYHPGFGKAAPGAVERVAPPTPPETEAVPIPMQAPPPPPTEPVPIPRPAPPPPESAARATERKPEKSTRRKRRKGEPKRAATPEVEHFGSYEILEELGRGAMGVVFKAQHTNLGRVVALKVLSAGEKATARQIQRFRRETEALARLKHPNIVSIYEVGAEQGYPYYTMDLVHGDSLEYLLSKGELSNEQMGDILEQISVGIDYVHAHGFIHRDLKPANVLVDETGRARITDFGLAANQFSSLQLTMSGMSVGTPLYMSPEQSRAEREITDGRADIWALGVILYRFLAGKLPFTGKNPVEIYEKINRLEPELPSTIKPDTDKTLQTICMKCLEKEPAKRYLRARFLADDLRRYKKGLPLRSAERAASMGLRDRPWLLAALIFAGLLLLVTLYVALFPPGSNPVVDPGSGNTAETADSPEEFLAQARQALRAKTPSVALNLLAQAREALETSPPKLPDGGVDQPARQQLRSELHRVSAQAYLLRGAADDEASARAELELARQADPDNFEALRLLARMSSGRDARDFWNDLLRAVPDDNEALLWLARWAFDDRDWREARDNLNRLISLGGDAEAYELRGFTLLHLRKPDEAESDFQLALAHDSSRAHAYLGRAQARQAQEKTALAELDYARAARYAELRLEATLARAAMLLELGRFDATIEVCLASPELALESPELNAMVGQARLFKGEFEAAERALRNAIDAGLSDAAGTHVWLGVSQAVRGLDSEACESYDAALQADPEHCGALVFRSLLAMEVAVDDPEKLARAAADLELAASLAPDASFPRLLLASLHMQEGQWVDAGVRLTEAMSRAPYQAAVYELQAQLDLHNSIERMARDNLERALQLYGRASGSSASVDRSRFQLARIERLLALGKAGLTASLGTALELCGAHLRTEPGSARAYLLLAEIHAARGELEEARQAFRTARDRNPLLAEASAGEAAVLALISPPRWDEAAALLVAALELEPNRIDWMLRLAQVEAEAGRADGALEWLEKLSRLKPLEREALELKRSCAERIGRPQLAQDAQTALQEIEQRGEKAQQWLRKGAEAASDRDALVAFQRALELEPESTPAALGIARSLMKMGDFEHAALSYARAVLADNSQAGELIAWLSNELGDERRVRLWSWLIDEDPRTPAEELRRNLCTAALTLLDVREEPEKLDAGLQAVEALIQAQPACGLAYALRAQLQLELGLYGPARLDLELAGQLDAELAEVPYARALLAALEEDAAEGVRQLERALDLGFRDALRIQAEPRFVPWRESDAWKPITRRLQGLE